MNEANFQKWVISTLLPICFSCTSIEVDLVDILRLSDRKSSGYPDLLIMTTNGVIAMELKYRNFDIGISVIHPDKEAFKHPISRLQMEFLRKWDACTGGNSFVLYGVNDNLYLIPYKKMSTWTSYPRIMFEDVDKASIFHDRIAFMKKNILESHVETIDKIIEGLIT